MGGAGRAVIVSGESGGVSRHGAPQRSPLVSVSDIWYCKVKRDQGRKEHTKGSNYELSRYKGTVQR